MISLYKYINSNLNQLDSNRILVCSERNEDKTFVDNVISQFIDKEILTISIQGPAKSGKTTLLMLLENLMEYHK
jgi:ABC-type lipoprotein export system ATPase subunit